jgi:hypothetical protein
MKRLLMVLALLGLSASLLVPAEAAAPVQTAPQVAANAQGLCYPTLESGCKVAPYPIFNQFKWTTNFEYDVRPVCIADGIGQPTAWPVATAAQSWNNATSFIAINVKANCVTAGYGAGRRATVDTYSALDGRCYKITRGDYTTNGTLGFYVYTENPIMWVQVNTAYNCNSTGFRRTHWLAVAIGEVLGLGSLPSTSAYASRLMSPQTQDTLAGPSSSDAGSLNGLYGGNYVGTCYGESPWPSTRCPN